MCIRDRLNTIESLKNNTGKDKAIVIQPFGRGVVNTDGFIFDPTSRSFNVSDIASIINDLKKDYTVIIMSEFQFDTGESKHMHAIPQVPDIRLWAGLIQCADHFLGCDSVGQHIARAMDTTATVVTGSTFPINISYPNEKSFDIFDMGEGIRTYSPLRMTGEDMQDMENDECMTMTKDDVNKVIASCRKRLGKPTTRKIVKNKEWEEKESCCDDPYCPTSTVKTPRGFKQ